MTILSDQSVVFSVLTPPFSINLARLEHLQIPQKKVPGTIHNFCVRKTKKTVLGEPSRAVPYHALEIRHIKILTNHCKPHVFELIFISNV